MTTPRITRRDFLHAGVLAAAWPLVARGSRLTAGDAPAVPSWCERPMRFANLTLVEEDSGRFDPGYWLDYFREIRADCATLSAGGYMAYYPTEIPLHHRSKNQGKTDPFGTLYRGCRELGMNVIARVDPHACREEVRVAHPDWISTDAEGRPRRHLAMPDRWITCALGPYNFEFMRAVIGEIVTKYPVDAVFSNRWNGIGRCHCENCRTNFRAAAGIEIPVTEDADDPANARFLAWQQARLFALWDLWSGTVRAANPEACFIPNMGGGIWQSLDMREIGRRAPILFADRQGRTAGATGGRGLTAPWAIGRAAKEFRAVMGTKPVVAGYSIGVEEPYRWKDSVQSEAEQRVWMADGVANGLRLSFGKTGATVRDDRWMAFTSDLFRWHHRHERELRPGVPLARVGMVYSQRQVTHYGSAKEPIDPSTRAYHNFIDFPYRAEDHGSGLYQAMVEARIPFEMVCDQLLATEDLSRFRLLVLPNIAVLDDSQCEVLRRFVSDGGSVLATYETSLHDGVRWRSEFGLADLFGVTFRGRNTEPTLNSYLTLRRDAVGAGEVLRGFEGASRMVGGVWYVDVGTSADAGAAVPLTLVPSYPNLPMEEVYPRAKYTDTPELILRRTGTGRVAYLPWDVDRLYWEALVEDHGRLLANTLRWALDEAPVVEVTGGGVLDIVPWRREGGLTLHLVNFTNPFMMKGPFREFIDPGPQRVTMRVPRRTEINSVRALVAEQSLAFERDGDRVMFIVPGVRDREVVAIDFEA